MTAEEAVLYDARRAQIMGAAWLAQWTKNGRGRGNEGKAFWIGFAVESREAPQYAWIWVQPYLDSTPEHDEYRGQQAGSALLDYFMNHFDTSSQYWMDAAKRQAQDTDETWLFLDPVLERDGWRKTKTQNGKPAWTKVK